MREAAHLRPAEVVLTAPELDGWRLESPALPPRPYPAAPAPGDKVGDWHRTTSLGGQRTRWDTGGRVVWDILVLGEESLEITGLAGQSGPGASAVSRRFQVGNI